MFNFNQFKDLAKDVLEEVPSDSKLQELYNNPIYKSQENLICELVELKHTEKKDGDK